MRQDIEFMSDGQICRGWLITPNEGNGPFPVIVMAGGWCYVKEIMMPHYADFFVKAGFATILFDYRNFGGSDGMPRQHLDPSMQIEDYKNAISFAETLPEVDNNRIGIWGISYSGGHVLTVGATDPRVKCIVSVIAVVDGLVTMQRLHPAQRFTELLEVILEDRRKRFQDPASRGNIPFAAPDPVKTLCTLPDPNAYEIFMRLKETEAPLHEHYSTIESVELLLSYTVFPYVSRIWNTPTQMIVVANDNITAWDREIEAYHQISSATKKLVVMPNASHMSLYSERTHLEIAAEEGTEWFKEHLGTPVSAAPGAGQNL